MGRDRRTESEHAARGWHVGIADCGFGREGSGAVRRCDSVRLGSIALRFSTVKRLKGWCFRAIFHCSTSLMGELYLPIGVSTPAVTYIGTTTLGITLYYFILP